MSFSPGYYWGGGFAFPNNGPQIVFNTNWGVVNKAVTIYTEGLTEPTHENSPRALDLDLALQAGYHGFNFYFGYRMITEVFHVGVGFEKDFDLPKLKMGKPKKEESK